MDERRLVVVVDETGLIQRVGGSPKALFGFEPKLLLGKPLSDIVDVLHQTSTGEVQHLQETLTELAIRWEGTLTDLTIGLICRRPACSNR